MLAFQVVQRLPVICSLPILRGVPFVPVKQAGEGRQTR
jgi:hypothetical protein